MKSLLSKVQTGFIKKNLFLTLHGPMGVGKTTFGSQAPKPLFFDYEESSLSMSGVSRVMPSSFEETMDTLYEILSKKEGEFEYKTLVFDSADRLEEHIHKKVASDYEKADIDDISYKRGYIYALDYWQKFISLCKKIRDHHKVHIVILCHSFVKRGDDPIINEAFDRYVLKLHHKASDLLTELSEIVLFTRKDISIKKEKGKDKIKAFNVEERFLYTQLHAAYDAKNRIGLPAVIKFDETGAFDVLLDLYDKASGETAEDVYKQCLQLIKRVKNKDLAKQMTDYTNEHKDKLNTLRSIIERVNENIKGDRKDVE